MYLSTLHCYSGGSGHLALRCDDNYMYTGSMLANNFGGFLFIFKCTSCLQESVYKICVQVSVYEICGCVERFLS